MINQQNKERIIRVRFKHVLLLLFLVIIVSFFFIKKDDFNLVNNRVDSDNDTIPDYLDPHPHGDSRKVVRIMNNVEIDFDLDVYDYYRNKKRIRQGLEYITLGDPSLKRVLELYEKERRPEVYKSEPISYPLRISSAYDLKHIIDLLYELDYVRDASLNFDDYPKYPAETLVEQNGDCEDTAYLFASILGSLGERTLLVIFDDHVGIAVAIGVNKALSYWVDYNYKKCTYSFEGKCNLFEVGHKYDIDGLDYYYIETTNGGWDIGEMPEEYKTKKPKLIPVPYLEGGTLTEDFIYKIKL